jgi:hypothetical protein
MLAPGQSTTACHTEWAFWGADVDLIAGAFQQLLERDAEADGVINVKVDSISWSVGIYARRCVTLRGDVVRSIRAVVLPMPAAHMHSHGAP